MRHGRRFWERRESRRVGEFGSPQPEGGAQPDTGEQKSALADTGCFTNLEPFTKRKIFVSSWFYAPLLPRFCSSSAIQGSVVMKTFKVPRDFFLCRSVAEILLKINLKRSSLQHVAHVHLSRKLSTLTLSQPNSKCCQFFTSQTGSWRNKRCFQITLETCDLCSETWKNVAAFL